MPNVMKPMEPKEGATAETVREDPDINENLVRVKVLSKNIVAIPGEKKIDEADIVIAGGRGAAKNGDLKELEELAAVMGGAKNRAVIRLGCA